MIDFNDRPASETADTAGTMAARALAYAEAGIPVFPCNPLDKRPLLPAGPGGTGGFHLATTNPLQIKAWWAKWPNAMIGAPTGKASGLVALDVDQDPARGKYGIETLHAIGHPLEELFDHPHTQTAGGGYHVFFAYEEERPIRNTAGAVGRFLDTRGEGGYVILAGSRTADGRAYTALADLSETPLTPAPEWLHEALSAGAGGSNTSSLDFNTAGKLGEPFGPNAAKRAGEIPPGQWHEKTRDLVARMVREGSSDETILALAPRFTEAGYTDEQTIRDFAAHIRTARAKWGYVATALVTQPAEHPGIQPTAFAWQDPATIPPREWLYARHYIRKFCSGTIAPGGTGKSSLVQVEALSMATGLDLLNTPVLHPLRVWAWNGEDPHEEIMRRVMAACVHFGVTPEHIGDRLFLDSGRDLPIVLVGDSRDGAVIAEPMVEQLIAALTANKIDVLIIDPFVSCHRVSENDNAKIDTVVKTWNRVAERANCAIELVHHVRKAPGDVTIEDARGAAALKDGLRMSRVLNVMGEEDAARFNIGVAERRAFVRVDSGKVNLTPAGAGPLWRRLVSVSLGNATKDRPADSVGVITAWEPVGHLACAGAARRFAAREAVCKNVDIY